MKKYLKLIVCVLAVVMLVACEDKNTPQVDTNEYYVRYSISYAPNISARQNVTYADVDGIKTITENNKTSLWDVTIGPVKKGFKAYVSCKSESNTTAKIEVCKNSGPFVLKATGTNSAEYKIDF